MRGACFGVNANHHSAFGIRTTGGLVSGAATICRTSLMRPGIQPPYASGIARPAPTHRLAYEGAPPPPCRAASLAPLFRPPTQEASHSHHQRLHCHQLSYLMRSRRLLSWPARLHHARPRHPFSRHGRHPLPHHGQPHPPRRLPRLRHTVEVKHCASCPSNTPPQMSRSC
jgi:hypothetical protein